MEAIVLGLSIALQFAAAAIAIWLIRVTGRRTAWLLIATAVTLMALRRGVTLYRLVSGDTTITPDLTAELIALTISVLLIVGLALIYPLLQSIQRSEQRFRDLLESAPDAMLVVDRRGEIALVNSQTESLFGYRREELLGQPIEILIPDRFREKHVTQRNVYLTAPTVRPMGTDLELFGVKRDGTDFPVEISLSPIQTEEGQLVAATVRDISRHKMLERLSSERIERLQKLSELSMTLSGDPTEIFQHISRMIGELMDVDVVCLSEIRGEELFFLCIYDHGEVTINAGHCPLRITPCQSVQQNNDIRVYHNVAELFPEDSYLKEISAYSYCGFPVLDSAGRVILVTCVLDHRPRQFSEEDRNLLRIFGQRIGMEMERRRHLNERKQAASDREELIGELEAKNAELERYTYTVSHDLKSPLITIKGFLGLLERDALEGNAERLKDDVLEIGNAADRMNRLLDELLKLSRIGRVANPSEEVSFASLVQETLETISGRVAEGVVENKVENEFPVFYGDRVRLQEVVQNLVDNAIKFSADDPHIEIGVRRDNDEVVCYVSDNGLGIEKNYQEKIFGLFEQLDAKRDGTGIGLAISRRIVELHDGRIWVESEGLGTGSRFCFTFPRIAPPDEQTSQVQPHLRSRDYARSTGHNSAGRG